MDNAVMENILQVLEQMTSVIELQKDALNALKKRVEVLEAQVRGAP